MADNQVYDDEQWDRWNDADMADPTALPEKTRFVGYVSKIDEAVAEAKDGSPFRDGRTKVPQIVLTLTAVGIVGQGRFDRDTNYYTSAPKKFWVGQVDTDSRRYLRRLIEDGAGKTKEEIGSLGLVEAAKLLEKVYFTYTITNKEGDAGAVFSTPAKIKAATAEEVSEVA